MDGLYPNLERRLTAEAQQDLTFEASQMTVVQLRQHIMRTHTIPADFRRAEIVDMYVRINTLKRAEQKMMALNRKAEERRKQLKEARKRDLSRKGIAYYEPRTIPPEFRRAVGGDVLYQSAVAPRAPQAPLDTTGFFRNFDRENEDFGTGGSSPTPPSPRMRRSAQSGVFIPNPFESMAGSWANPEMMGGSSPMSSPERNIRRI